MARAALHFFPLTYTILLLSFSLLYPLTLFFHVTRSPFFAPFSHFYPFYLHRPLKRSTPSRYITHSVQVKRGRRKEREEIKREREGEEVKNARDRRVPPPLRRLTSCRASFCRVCLFAVVRATRFCKNNVSFSFLRLSELLPLALTVNIPFTPAPFHRSLAR